MKNWQPSKFQDIWKESYPNEQFMDEINFPVAIFVFFLSILFGILTFFWRSPIIGIQLITLIHDPNWLQFLGLALSIFFSASLYGIATLSQAFDALKSILRYLNNDLAGKFTLQERTLEDYIGEDKIQEIKAARLVSWNKANQYPICRLFVRHPSLEGIVAGQKKGFAAPVAYYKIGAPPKSISLIFIDELPNELTDSSKFFIYHEIGHTTKHAWRVKTKPYTAKTKLVPLAIWILFNTSNYLISLPCLFIYILIRVFFEIDPSRNSFEDEVVADTFAILKLPESIPLDDKDNPRKNLKKILEKIISAMSREDLTLRLFHEKRLENVINIIQARKEKGDISMMEKTRNISGFGMLVMNALLILSITPLKSPSMGFFVSILLLTLMLCLAVSFIHIVRIIPYTHLIEESIRQLLYSPDQNENICQN